MISFLKATTNGDWASLGDSNRGLLGPKSSALPLRQSAPRLLKINNQEGMQTVYQYIENADKNECHSMCESDVNLNLNLNSLLVKRQIDNPSPGAVTGGN